MGNKTEPLPVKRGTGPLPVIGNGGMTDRAVAGQDHPIIFGLLFRV